MEGEVEFQRISLTGFRICTNRSHYRSISKQTTQVNHANQFVPKPVQLNDGRPKTNSVRPNINIGRTNINSVRLNVNTGRVNVNPVRPTVNTGSSNVNTVRSR
ncbi:hypothetical protein Tco_1142888 [Tanacetum coccineum]